jgi:hypothetical protein
VLRGRRLAAKRFVTVLTGLIDEPELRAGCQAIATMLRDA